MDEQPTDRWQQMEDRIKVLEGLAADIKWEDNSVEENRYDIISELMEKAMQGFEIYDEHKKRSIPTADRIVLESRLLERMSHAFDRVELVMKDFYGKDSHFANLERDELRIEIRLLDLEYAEIHTSFLKSYLGMDW